jgi:hypothetical protein
VARALRQCEDSSGACSVPRVAIVRVVSLLLLMTVAVLAIPSTAQAEPMIDRVIVSRDASGLLRFRIVFTGLLVILDRGSRVQIAIDADRDSDTGINGAEYSLDLNGPPWERSSLALLKAVGGEPVVSHPPALRLGYTGDEVLDIGATNMTFSIPASLIGDPRRFDFYVFTDVNGKHDQLPPQHLFFSEGLLTYPKEPTGGDAYPVETYVAGSKSDDGITQVVANVLAALLGIGALVAIAWYVRRRVNRKHAAAPPTSPGALLSHPGQEAGSPVDVKRVSGRTEATKDVDEGEDEEIRKLRTHGLVKDDT